MILNNFKNFFLTFTYVFIYFYSFLTLILFIIFFSTTKHGPFKFVYIFKIVLKIKKHDNML